jgi:hypothetical protein
MTKIPIKTRLPLSAWVVAALVALFSLVSSLMHAPASNGLASAVAQADLISSNTLTTAAIH